MKPLAAFACLLLLAACRTQAPAPPLPSLDTSAFEPAVSAEVGRALAAAQSAPLDAAKVADLGVVLHAHEQFATAAAAYRRALALQPNADIHYLLGVVLAADGKYAEAVEPLRQALAAQPAAAAIRLKLADSLLASGNLDAARAEYQALLARDPQSAAAHYGLGRTLSGAEAMASHRKALDLFPRYGAAQFALAAAYRRAGQTKEAEAVLVNYERDKTTIPPLHDPALNAVLDRSVSSTGLIRKAQIMDRQGDIAGALQLHKQIVQTNPKLDQAWVNMISLYARTGQPAQVDAAYAQAVALAPNRADTHYNYGVFCVEQQRWPAAEKAFARALALDPQNPQAAHNLGAVIERTGDLARAAALFRQAIALDPAHRQAHFHLGRILANQRRYLEAIAMLEKSIQPLDAESPTYLYALGATQARAGQKQLAFATLQRAQAEAERFQQPTVVAAIARDLQTLTR